MGSTCLPRTDCKGTRGMLHEVIRIGYNIRSGFFRNPLIYLFYCSHNLKGTVGYGKREDSDPWRAPAVVSGLVVRRRVVESLCHGTVSKR